MAESSIHPTSVIEPGAKIGNGVRIGPFCYVGAGVVLGDGVQLMSHVSITGETTIGERTSVHSQAVLGGPPQDIKHRGGKTTLSIGRECTIREAVTMSAGSDGGGGRTVVGDNGMFLANSHVGHDCVVGDNVTMANYSALGGHCHVSDNVTLGALVGIHQYARLGRHSFITSCGGTAGDVLPFCISSMIGGTPALRGLNLVGLTRAGMPRSEITALRKTYMLLFDGKRPVNERGPELLERFPDSPAVAEVAQFISESGKRYLARPLPNKVVRSKPA